MKKLFFCCCFLAFTASIKAQCAYFVAFTATNVSTNQVNLEAFIYDTMCGGNVITPTYLWSTGETTQNITVNAAGNYCVIATLPNGNAVSTCQYVNGPCAYHYCYTYFYPDSTGSGQQSMIAYTSQANTTYQWQDNSTSQTLNITESGNYCVTATNAIGCTATACENVVIPDCQTFITYTGDSTIHATSFGVAPFQYTWSDGSTTETTNITNFGNICVTMTDASGCQSTDCNWIWYQPQCGVSLSSFGDYGIQAFGFGTAPLTYSWSDPNFSGDIIYLDSTAQGQICVTITDATGCSAVNCEYHNALCTLSVNIIPNTFPVEIQAYTYPYANQYLWSNGETTPTIQVTEAGEYCVTTTTSFGCVFTQCVTYDPTLWMSVWISTVDSLNYQNLVGDIWVIKYDSIQGTLTAIDTVPFNYGYAQFSLAPGNYLFKASLSPDSSDIYNDYLPTYHFSSLYWSEAQPLEFNHNLNQFAQIQLIKGQNLGGPGFIGGYVSQGANFSSGGVDDRNGNPMAGVVILLHSADGTPLHSAVTDANGQYAFPNLPWGTYRINIEIPGIPTVFQVITIGPNQPSVTSIDFIVDENSAAVVKTTEVAPASFFKIYPNPVSETLQIKLPEGKSELTLVNAQGIRVAFQEENGSNAQIMVKDLPAGIYFLTVKQGGRIFTERIFKN
jgi:Carboxypeptidase regulatory-like domain/Secretion system C-terminal sorting domain